MILYITYDSRHCIYKHFSSWTHSDVGIFLFLFYILSERIMKIKIIFNIAKREKFLHSNKRYFHSKIKCNHIFALFQKILFNFIVEINITDLKKQYFHNSCTKTLSKGAHTTFVSYFPITLIHWAHSYEQHLEPCSFQ